MYRVNGGEGGGDDGGRSNDGGSIRISPSVHILVTYVGQGHDVNKVALHPKSH